MKRSGKYINIEMLLHILKEKEYPKVAHSNSFRRIHAQRTLNVKADIVLLAPLNSRPYSFIKVHQGRLENCI